MKLEEQFTATFPIISHLVQKYDNSAGYPYYRQKPENSLGHETPQGWICNTILKLIVFCGKFFSYLTLQVKPEITTSGIMFLPHPLPPQRHLRCTLARRPTLRWPCDSASKSYLIDHYEKYWKLRIFIWHFFNHILQEHICG